jgi:hypothetical protein
LDWTIVKNIRRLNILYCCSSPDYQQLQRYAPQTLAPKITKLLNTLHTQTPYKQSIMLLFGLNFALKGEHQNHKILIFMYLQKHPSNTTCWKPCNFQLKKPLICSTISRNVNQSKQWQGTPFGFSIPKFSPAGMD